MTRDDQRDGTTNGTGQDGTGRDEAKKEKSKRCKGENRKKQRRFLIFASSRRDFCKILDFLKILDKNIHKLRKTTRELRKHAF